VKAVYHQKEWTDEEVKKIDSLKKILPANVSFHEYYDQFLFHPDDLTFHYSETPKVFTQFRKQLEKKALVRSLVSMHPQEVTSRVKTDFKLPTLEQLGFEDFEIDSRTAFPFKGGSKAAEQRLEDYFFKTHSLGVYKKTRNGLLGENYSSKFSPWLANGSLSARQIYWKIKAFEEQFYANQSTYWLIFELIWRDFFKYISLKNGNAIFKLEGILNTVYGWSKNSKLTKEWTDGRTADDFVNANMIELKNTGWMSNRGRQNVASYFAKTLKLDWRIGAAYFESMLLDYDVHSNYGNWMYVSGVGNDLRDRIFDLKRQAEMYDHDKRFRNHWLK
jgi:deoxyribodipyrimidine photo-lyase